MDLEKLKKSFKGLSKNQNFANALIAILIIIFLWLAGSTFLGGGVKNSNNTKKPIGAQEVVSNSTNDRQLLDYEEQQRHDIEEILKKMQGVGEVEVVIHFESSEVQVPAFNSTTQTSETKEQDREGGTRTTNQENGGNTVVMSNSGTSNKPFIVKTYKPPIVGVLIVAEGAESNKIKYDIQSAISSLYNLSLEKVNVYPMK